MSRTFVRNNVLYVEKFYVKLYLYNKYYFRRFLLSFAWISFVKFKMIKS